MSLSKCQVKRVVPCGQPALYCSAHTAYGFANLCGIYSMNTHLYQEKYRISSTGLRGWDYASNAAYYVTIVTQQHRHVFGAIHEGRMYHNALGTAAFECWQEIPKHFPFVV